MKIRILLSTIIALVIFALVAMMPVYAAHDDDMHRSSDPKIAINESDAYVVWIESMSSEFADVYFAKILDGISVEEPLNITKGTSIRPSPQIHVNGNNVYLLWEDRISKKGNDVIVFAKSNDYGKTFSEPKPFPSDNESFYRPASIYQVNDIVYVFGSHWSRATQQNNIIYMASNDFGETFSEPIVLFNHEQSDQDITVRVHDDTIYVMSDDRNDFDEIGSLYLRKILPDGTLTDIVNVNGGKTTIAHAQFAVSAENVYVSWRDRVFEKTDNRPHERWYQVFTKSHDGGKSFGDVIRFASDPNSIDTVGIEGNFVFSKGDTVFVLWKSEYWDGKTQSFKTYLASSHDKGNTFASKPLVMDKHLQQYGYIVSELDDDSLHLMGITGKNTPYNDAAVYYSSMNSGESTKPVDILKNVRTEIGWMPDVQYDGSYIHFVTEGSHNKNCILYSFSDNGGKSFRDVINISPNGNDIDCLGVTPDLLPPLKQISVGIAIQDIQCKDDRPKGYVLALKERDSQPVCVSADSYLHLVERNWIKEDSQVILSLESAKQFVLSSPTFSFDGIPDSLELEVTQVRKSIPPAVTVQGTFQTEHAGYGDRTGQEFPHEEKPHNNSIDIQVVRTNQIHSAVIDGTWSEVHQIPVMELPKRQSIHGHNYGPTSHIVLTIGDAINSRGMIPVLISEFSENVSGHATFWQFQPIKRDSAQQRGVTWDFLPDDYEAGWGFLDENGNDAWDNSKINRDNYAIFADGHGYPAFCEGKKIEGESWHPSGIPILPNIKNIVAKSGQLGYYPDSDGIYRLDYVTLFDTLVEFPPNAEIIENKKILCPMDDNVEDATHAYYTKIVFKLGKFVPESVLQPKYEKSDTGLFAPTGHNLGDAHEHASILVKIFGDKFDFTSPKYQIQSSWIHFEGGDGNTIHRHSKEITLGYLFDTLNLGLTSDCFVFEDGREFCTDDEYSIKFYINGKKVNDIRDYEIFDDDRILVSYGPESQDEINEQIAELNLQDLIY